MQILVRQPSPRDAFLSLLICQPLDQQNRKAQAIELFEYAHQRRLVSYTTNKGGLAWNRETLAGDNPSAAKQLQPALLKDALRANAIMRGIVRMEFS